MGASLIAFDDYHGPAAAVKHGAAAMMTACVIHKMPPDWADRAKHLELENTEYQAAKALDPDFPDPAKIFPPSRS